MSDVQADHRRRLEELILYLARRMEADQHVGRGRIKLAKLLFFIDFEAYARWGQSISRTAYHADEHGPAPTGELMATRDLESAGRFEWRREWDRQELPVALDDPKDGTFSDTELALIDDYLDRYRLVSARRMIDEAHQFAGWTHAWDNGRGRGRPVMYEAIFWDNARAGHVEEWEKDYARELAGQFAHRLRSS